jgi:hypothetical protein
MPSPQVFSRGRTKILLLVLFFAGCQGNSGLKDESAEVKHIRNVGNLCFQYAEVTKKRPASIDEVKQWAIREGKATGEDFLSTRDNQPYGIASVPMGANEVMVFEQTGSDGKCYMLIKGNATEIAKDDLDRQIESFQSIKPGKGGAKGGSKTR